jgi:hypothetical protein
VARLFICERSLANTLYGICLNKQQTIRLVS